MCRPSGCQFQYRKDFSRGESVSVSSADIKKVLCSFFFPLSTLILSQNSFREVNVWCSERRRILRVFSGCLASSSAPFWSSGSPTAPPDEWQGGASPQPGEKRIMSGGIREESLRGSARRHKTRAEK